MGIVTAALFVTFGASPAFAQGPAADGADENVVIAQAQRDFSLDLLGSVDRNDQTEIIARGRSSVVEADFVRFDASPAARWSAIDDPVSWIVGAFWKAILALNMDVQHGRSSTPVDSLLVIGSCGDAACDLTTGEGFAAGFKARWMDGRLQATLAFFDLSQQDSPSTNPNNCVQAIPIGENESHSQCAGGCDDCSYSAFVEAEDARCVEFGAVRTGNTPPSLPEVVANVFADWRFGPDWSAGLAVRAVDGVFANASSTTCFPGSTLMDADVCWRIAAGVEVSTIGCKLGDEDCAVWRTGACGQDAMANIGPGCSVLGTIGLQLFDRVAYRFDLVAVGIAHEGCVIIRMIVGAQARLAVVDAAALDRGDVKRINSGARGGAKAHMHAVADTGWLAIERQLHPEIGGGRLPIADRRQRAADLDGIHRQNIQCAQHCIIKGFRLFDIFAADGHMIEGHGSSLSE